MNGQAVFAQFSCYYRLVVRRGILAEEFEVSDVRYVDIIVGNEVSVLLGSCEVDIVCLFDVVECGTQLS